LAVKGYRTTWGAAGFEKQTVDEDAVVVQRLDEAGAVLVAKLTLGALAQGDVWFGGKTRNPWNPAQGSSDLRRARHRRRRRAAWLSASVRRRSDRFLRPRRVCGCTGLRPTFGFVPRTGAMALSWSMDKLGPICRSVEDCALVMSAIYGPDGKDRTVKNAAFNWDAELDWKKLRIGYLKSDFERSPQPQEDAEKEEPAISEEAKKKREEQRKKRAAFQERAKYDRRFAEAALAKLQDMGVALIPVEMPKFPYDPMVAMLTAEAAAAFDELTRSGRDKLLTAQSADDWPNTFRSARFIPAVEYIQASRARRMAMDGVAAVFDTVDVIVAPTGSEQLVITNLTGYPALILPNGFRGDDAPKPPAKDDGDDDNIGGPGNSRQPDVSWEFVPRGGAAGIRACLSASYRVPSQAPEAELKPSEKIRTADAGATISPHLL